MVDLNTWANVAEVLGGATVLGGLIFAMYQVRHLRRQRADASAVELVHSIQTDAFLEAFNFFIELPETPYNADDWKPGSDRHRHITEVGFVCETMAILVQRGVIPLDLLDELIGGFLRVLWRHFQPHAEAQRRRLANNHYFEWVQWLVERLHEHPSPGKAKGEGAYVTYRDWRPQR